MVCIHCGSETHVFNSRHQKRLNQVWRRRRCSTCGAVFSTNEIADYSAALLVRDPKGHISPLLRDKLFLSLLKSCQHRKTAITDAGGLTDTIIAKLVPQAIDSALDSTIIMQTVQVALNRFDKASSVHYQAFHRL